MQKRKVILIALIIFILITMIFPQKTNIFVTENADINTCLDLENKEYVYTINNKKNIETFRIRFGTYTVTNLKGTLNIELYNNNEKILDKELKLDSIIDNGYIYFDVPKYEKKSNEYKLKISYKDYKENNKICLWSSNNTENKNYKLEDDLNNSIQIEFKEKKSNYIVVWYSFMIFFLYITYLVLEGEFNNEKK